MDIYAPDVCFRIDDLLDFSNDDLFSSSSAATLSPPHQNPSILQNSPPFDFSPSVSTDFTHHLSIPSDDVAHLEWLSQFVEDSFVDLPTNSLTVPPNTSFSGKNTAPTSGSNPPSAWKSSSETSAQSVIGRSKIKKDRYGRESTEEGIRRCSHCASVKTPQWRTGPLGPKTLCNACGVRYKSGRLVPEYRPAASPTFVLTQHSNSHRKVLELRRQKEMQRQQMEEDHRMHHHHRDFEVS